MSPEAGSQRGRKSFVATPEQRNNVKILVGLTLCLAWRLTLASGSQTRNHTAAAAKATNAMRAATFYAVARDTLLVTASTVSVARARPST